MPSPSDRAAVMIGWTCNSARKITSGTPVPSPFMATDKSTMSERSFEILFSVQCARISAVAAQVPPVLMHSFNDCTAQPTTTKARRPSRHQSSSSRVRFDMVSYSTCACSASGANDTGSPAKSSARRGATQSASEPMVIDRPYSSTRCISATLHFASVGLQDISRCNSNAVRRSSKQHRANRRTYKPLLRAWNLPSLILPLFMIQFLRTLFTCSKPSPLLVLRSLHHFSGKRQTEPTK